MDLTNFYLIVRPHPAFKELKYKILNDFKKKMNTTIDNLSILNNLEVIKISDYIFFDEGQIILDILNLKRKYTKAAKLIDEDIPLDFDKNKNYSILSSKIDIKKFLNIKY